MYAEPDWQLSLILSCRTNRCGDSHLEALDPQRRENIKTSSEISR